MAGFLNSFLNIKQAYSVIDAIVENGLQSVKSMSRQLQGLKHALY